MAKFTSSRPIRKPSKKRAKSGSLGWGTGGENGWPLGGVPLGGWVDIYAFRS